MALGLKKKTAPKPQKQAQKAAPVEPTPASLPVVQTPHKFTARQAAFIEHYVVNRNASEAARKAGYAKKAANIEGSRLLSNVHIRAEIERRTAKVTTKLAITAERVVEELAKVAFANMADYMEPGEDGSPVLRLDAVTRDQAAALGSLTVEEFKDGRSDKREVRRTKFTLWDKTKALELLGRRFNLWGGDGPPSDPRETLTLLGMLMREIDAADRGHKVIEHR